MSKSRAQFEIKTACGDLTDTFDAPYIIYCPYVDTTLNPEEIGFVFTKEEWHDFLNGYGGRGQFLRTLERNGVKETHIQSFYVSETVRPKASKAISDYIFSRCNEQYTVADFFEKERTEGRSATICKEEIDLRRETDTGRLGKAYELAIRYYISGRRWRRVKGARQVDIMATLPDEMQ